MFWPGVTKRCMLAGLDNNFSDKFENRGFGVMGSWWTEHQKYNLRHGKWAVWRCQAVLSSSVPLYRSSFSLFPPLSVFFLSFVFHLIFSSSYLSYITFLHLIDQSALSYSQFPYFFVLSVLYYFPVSVLIYFSTSSIYLVFLFLSVPFTHYLSLPITCLIISSSSSFTFMPFIYFRNLPQPHS